MKFKGIMIMKALKFIAAALVMTAAASCTSGNTPKTAENGTDSTKTVAPAKPAEPVNPKSLLPRKSEVDSVSYLMGVNFGSFIKGYNFGDMNYRQIRKGIKAFLKAKGNPRDSAFAAQFKINPEELNEAFNSYLSKRREYTLAVNKEKETEFLAKNAEKDSVQVCESGLQYIIRKAGNDVKPGPVDTVYVHYKGTLLDGTVFDQSPKNEDGVRMLLNRVIKGWTEGLQLVGEGGSIRLFVPSALGYGERGTQGIEPNSTLIFDVDVVKVNKVAPAEEEAEDNK